MLPELSRSYDLNSLYQLPLIDAFFSIFWRMSVVTRRIFLTSFLRSVIK